MPSRIAIKDPSATYAWKIRQIARCSICLDQNADWYEVHHIIKRGRSDEPCNYLLVCERCHRVIEGERVRHPETDAHLPPLSLGCVLFAKREQCPGEWEPDRLMELQQRSLPDPCSLPLEWLEISARNDPFNVYRKH